MARRTVVSLSEQAARDFTPKRHVNIDTNGTRASLSRHYLKNGA